MNTEKAIDPLDNLIGMVDDNQENDYDSALHMAINALKAQSDSDTISRQAAIDALKRIPENLEITEGYGHYLRGLIDADNAIRQLPSAQLKPKTGKWIPIVPVYSACKCSECGYDSDDYQPYSTFCPECGCVMSEEEGNDEDY